MKFKDKLILILFPGFLAFSGCQKESLETVYSSEQTQTQDSHLIVYSMIRNDYYSIHLMNTTGTRGKMIIDSLTMSPNPLWAPNGSKIAYYSESDLYVMNPDGSNNKQVTNTGKVEYVTFDWSPDSKQLVCSGNKKIWRVNSDGTNFKVLQASAGDMYRTQWSPDGTKIVYILSRGNGNYIYTIKADGTEPKALTNTGEDENPAWSPDGKLILFTSRRDGATQIYSMKPDGTNQVRLTFTTATEINHIWSPQSKKIAFISFRDDVSGGEIYVMDPDGKNQLRLTSNSSVDRPTDWSPDGTKLLFVSRRGGNSEIYTWDLEKGNEIRLTFSEGWEESARWSQVPIF